MRNFLVLLLLCFSANLCLGQKDITVIYNHDYSVTINGISIDKSTTYQEMVELLGEPEVYKEYRTGKTNYHYKELGLVIHTVDGKLLTLAFNFNWDGDKNFPNSTFIGGLTIGDKEIDKNTTADIVDELKSLGIECYIPRMCMNNPKTVKNPIILGFKDDLITQVSIEFH